MNDCFESNFPNYFSFLPLQTDQTEQEIIELLLGSLRFCDVDTVGPHQIMYQIRSGLIYHHLGNIYCRSYWLETNNDVRKKKLLRLCRLYYDKGSKLFESIEAPLEFIAIQIDRIDLQEILFDGKAKASTFNHATVVHKFNIENFRFSFAKTGTQNASQKTNFLEMALTIAHNSIDQLLKIESLDDSSSSSAEIIGVLKRFELSLQTVLKKLIRLYMNKPNSDKFTETYKKLYSLTLKNVSREDGNYAAFAQHLRNVLEHIKESTT